MDFLGSCHPWNIIKNFVLSFLMALSALIILAGCGDSPSDKFGVPISNREITPIARLFDYPHKYNGKTVTLKGVVDTQDQKGHWLYMKDEEARIYVDLFDSGFAVSLLTGKTILVEGRIEVTSKIPSLLAKGVEAL